MSDICIFRGVKIVVTAEDGAVLELSSDTAKFELSQTYATGVVGHEMCTSIPWRVFPIENEVVITLSENVKIKFGNSSPEKILSEEDKKSKKLFQQITILPKEAENGGD